MVSEADQMPGKGMLSCDFSREELGELGTRAHYLSKESGNKYWAQAYAELDYALCVLDALIARSEVRE